MIKELATSVFLAYGALSSRGNSEVAEFVSGRIEQGRRDPQASQVVGLYSWRGYSGLEQVYAVCQEHGWDGYGALPVSEDTYRLTQKFIDALPLGLSAPAFGAEPDGQLTVEWYSSPRRILSISVSAEGELHYAALLGASKAYGSEPFFGEVPRAIVDLIRRVTSAC